MEKEVEVEGKAGDGNFDHVIEDLIICPDLT
jgi:hypothetical protein